METDLKVIINNRQKLDSLEDIIMKFVSEDKNRNENENSSNNNLGMSNYSTKVNMSNYKGVSMIPGIIIYNSFRKRFKFKGY